MMTNKSRIPESNPTYEDGTELRRGPWTLEEDNLLIQYINCHGEGRWNSLAKYAGLKRTGKSCRLRWLNYLKPDVKRGNLTPREQILILELHSKWGNRWSKIAQNLPGRTDNEIKNYWRTRVQKQARQLQVDSNSKKFLEAIRTFWMPRLIEKIEQNSSSSNTSSPSSSSIGQKFTVPIPSSHVPEAPVSPCPIPPNQTVINPNNSNNNSSGNNNYNNSINNIVPEILTPPSSGGKFLVYEKSIQEECYRVGNIPSYDDMRHFEESQDIAFPECHVEGSDWFGEEFEGIFWNCTDELWQFRKTEEAGGVYSR